MLLNWESSENMRVITSVLIQIHKFIILEMTLEVTIPKPVTGMISIAWYMHLLTFKISQLQYHPSGRMTTFLRNTRNFIILAREYSMDLWPMLQVAK